MQIGQAVPNVISIDFSGSSKRQSDNALVAAIAKGNKAAMQALFRKHRLAVYRFALRLTHNQTTAEDIVSDVFLEVWRRADRFEARSRVSTWLLGITRNLAWSAMRQRQTEELSATVIERLEDTSDTPEAAVAKIQQRTVLAHCLTKLSPAHREVIDLVYYHEKSVIEVAEIVGIPQATVKTRMHYARLEVAELLKTYLQPTATRVARF